VFCRQVRVRRKVDWLRLQENSVAYGAESVVDECVARATFASLLLLKALWVRAMRSRSHIESQVEDERGAFRARLSVRKARDTIDNTSSAPAVSRQPG